MAIAVAERIEPLPAARPYPWILHPLIDLPFCCGGLVWILFGLHRWFDDVAHPHAVTVGLFVSAALLTQLFSNAHTMATLVRVYRDADTARRFAFCTRWLPLLCAAVGVAGITVPGMAPVLLKLYLVFLLPHHTMQVYGISLIYAYKRGYLLGDLEKRVVKSFLALIAIYPLLRQFTYPDWGSRVFMDQQIPFWGPLPIWLPTAGLALLLASAAGVLLVVVRKVVADRQLPPFPAAMLVATVVPYMLLGGRTSMLLWLYVTPLFHGSQYIVVSTAYYLKERGLPDGIAPAQIVRALAGPRALRYLGLLVLGGSFIYVGIPRALENMGISYTVSAGVILAVFNFHHFVTDRAVWRLRDPFVRRTLLA